MQLRSSHIASLLLAVWALVWGVNLAHEWFHHHHHHDSCVHTDYAKQEHVDGSQFQQLADETDCAVCDWDWGPVRTEPPVPPHLTRGLFALRTDFPRVDAGHRNVWHEGNHGRRGPPAAR